ncbi:protein kinase domain-containing protein [Haliangium ochraceum]|uniref:Serine/threonine protein kinase n=1 Tax=Haliangium ochraceum (strain DSM 14365 / JCM 11303 / SMP-2) TaxID=502025 RepID=D0LVZ4_HALO1|nr:protein kinase [Haliangium ochraceum]ACY14128.1 serine/threonine protein kinase [Haliangium ochraceum DSM 14365]
MTPNQRRWQQVKELFHAALDRTPQEREGFLAQRCADDASLRREIESLLAQHDDEDDFLSRPALCGAASEAPAGESAADALVGEQWSHYLIEELLAEGGMGTVYVARDQRLGRRVALKIPSPTLALRTDSLRRFEREALVGSALNHPNVVTVHEIAQVRGITFMVTELVEGETLAQMCERGPIEWRELVSIAAQAADALEALHEMDIVHRDIKTSNLMVTPRGLVKLLDLGLAKRLDEDEDEDEDEDDDPLRTRTGVLMGSVPFMSPEQSRGEPVDRRSDLFSLGVVMYQMACGRLPFVGDTSFETLEKIRSSTPAPVTSFNPAIPRALQRIINTCLAKRREQRYPSALLLAEELRALAEPASGFAAVTTRMPRLRRSRMRLPRARTLMWGGVGALLLATGAALALRFTPQTPPASPPPTGGPVAEVPRHFTQLTYRGGQEVFPSLGPDARWVIFAGRDGGDWDIYYQRIGGSNAFNLTADSAYDDTEPVLSPDGAHIAFRSTREGGGIYVMEVTGESVRRVVDEGANPSWSPDGRSLAYATRSTLLPNSRSPGELWTIDLASGRRRRVADADATQPAWSPGGHRIAYWGLPEGGSQRDIWTVSAEGGPPVAVTDDGDLDWNPVWSPDGRYLYFASDRGGSTNMWRVAIDERTGERRGAPEPVTTPSAYAAHLRFSSDGKHMVYADIRSASNLQRIAFDPDAGAVVGAPTWVTGGSLDLNAPDVSPDGEWLAMTVTDEANREDLLVMRVDGSERRRLTDDVYNDRTPRWAPDGSRIAFYSDRSGKYELWAVDPHGNRLEQLTFTTGDSVYYPVWSPDGSRVLVQQRSDGSYVIDAEQPWEAQTPERLADVEDTWFTGWSWSSDGDRLAGAVHIGDRHGLGTYTFSTGAYEILSDAEMDTPLWLADDRRMVAVDRRDPSVLYLFDSETGERRVLYSIAPDRFGRISLAPDGRTLYYARITTEADVWMAELP